MPSLPDDLDGLPLTTRRGIYYEIDALSYREAWVPGANRTVVVCRVLSNSAWDWVTDMVGETYFQSNTLRRHLPERNPFEESQWCTKVEQLDQGGLVSGTTFADLASGWPLTDWIRYRVTFEAMPFEMKTDAEADAFGNPELERYVIRGQRCFAKEQQIPAGAFKLVDDAVSANRLPLLQTGFRTRVYGDVTYTWVRVPVANLPLERFSLRGKLNSTLFDAAGASALSGYSWGIGDLLYVGFDDNNRYYDANADWVCDLVYTFRYAQGGWNFFLNSSGELKEVSLDGLSSGTKPYQSTDLHSLFTVD